ncbi:hypothetical protein F2P81_006679 [Scophthalmus maximus]|uniref:Uncharacterized protein n=1 Tax=Scophthalmus maximus TaxID=52904 RepID=A0A6A4TD20_SCOMX|nr:hypothetical protein F2P81_006679 [Scophthalmus maximus]
MRREFRKKMKELFWRISSPAGSNTCPLRPFSGTVRAEPDDTQVVIPLNNVETDNCRLSVLTDQDTEALQRSEDKSSSDMFTVYCFKPPGFCDDLNQRLVPQRRRILQEVLIQIHRRTSRPPLILTDAEFPSNLENSGENVPEVKGTGDESLS